MSEKTPMELIKEWLVQGKDDPDTFVDIKWQIIDKNELDGKLISFTVSHESYPIKLLVLDLEETSNVKAIRLVIETGVKTIDLRPEVKLSLYRILLNASRIPFVAFYIFGPEDEIGIAADIDKRTVTKEELEEHMKSLLFGFGLLTNIEEIRLQLLEESYQILLSLIASWLKEGMTQEEAIERLVKNGLDEELAVSTVKRVYAGIAKPKRSEGLESGIIHM